jgi:hypothetical protein
MFNGEEKRVYIKWRNFAVIGLAAKYAHYVDLPAMPTVLCDLTCPNVRSVTSCLIYLIYLIYSKVIPLQA